MNLKLWGTEANKGSLSQTVWRALYKHTYLNIRHIRPTLSGRTGSGVRMRVLGLASSVNHEWGAGGGQAYPVQQRAPSWFPLTGSGGALGLTPSPTDPTPCQKPLQTAKFHRCFLNDVIPHLRNIPLMRTIRKKQNTELGI